MGRDRWTPRLAERVLEVADAGHDPVEDAPEETVRLVADWLGLG